FHASPRNRAPMKCFYHETRDAIGVCKSCGKGLCRECAVDLDKGLACRGRCEEDARAVIALIDRNIRFEPTVSSIIARTRRGRVGAAVFYFVCGAAFIAWGFTMPELHVILFLGVAFVLYGLFTLWQVRQTPQPLNEPKA